MFSSVEMEQIAHSQSTETAWVESLDCVHAISLSLSVHMGMSSFMSSSTASYYGMQR